MSIFDSLASTSAAEPTQEEIDEKKKKDSLNPEFYISGDRWASAAEESRPEFAGKISNKIRGLYAADPKAKVLMKVEREGKVVDEDVPLFDDKGQPTAEGNDYFGKIDSYLQSAAADPNGGLELDPFTGKKRSVYQLKEIREEPLRKPVQFPDVAGFEEDLKSGFDVGGEKDLNFARYARWRNEKTDRPIDANDLGAQKAFDAQKKFTEFDPSSFGPDEKMRMVGGFPKFNEKFLGDREGVKAEIVALEGVSAHRKNEFLQEFQIEAYKPVAARLQLESDVFSALDKGERLSESRKKAVGDESPDDRFWEKKKDGVVQAFTALMTLIEVPIAGLTGREGVDLNEMGAFNEAVEGGDLVKARDAAAAPGKNTSRDQVVVMDRLIRRFNKEGITDGEEMGTIMRDTLKRNVWADGEEDKIRQLSNGELAYDPKTISARDPKEMHALIESQDASKEQKIALKRDYDFRRSYFAKAVYDGPLADEDADFKEWKAENKAKGITDPAKVLYSWKGLDTQFGGSYGWTGTTGNAIWDPLAGGGRGIANAGWSGSAMATTALSEGAGAIGLDRVSNWLKSGTVRAMEEIQENQALTAKDEALAGLRGERGPVRGVWNSTATSGVQMVPMLFGGWAGGAIKAAAGTNKGLQAIGTSVQNLGVYGYAGVQGAQSIYETALQKGEEKASLEGRKMSDDERYAVIQDNWIPALSNGVQTAMLTKLFAGSGVERMALGKAGAGGGGLTIREILSQGRNVAQTTSSWKEALRSIKPEVVKVLKTFHADAKGEFIEETSNQVIEGFIKRASVDPDKSFNELAGESIMAGFQGSFLGGGIPAATSAFSFNDKKGHQEAIKYAMVQQYSDKIQADVAAGKPTVEEGSSEEMMKHFEFISEKTKDYNKLREEKNFTGALAVNDEIDAATKTVSEKFGLGEIDGKVWDRFNGNKSAPAMATIFSNPNIEHKDKVELLLQAAKGESVLYSVNTEAPAAPPVSPSETTPIQSPSATNGEAKKEVVGDATWTLKAMGVDPGKNRVFKTSDHNPIVNDKGIKVEGGTLHSININGQPGAGAVLRSTDENGETVEQHVTAEKALALLPPNSMMNRNIKSDRTAYESSIQNHGTNINEWTEKQDGAGAGTNPEVAPPGEKGLGDPPSPKRVVDSEASGPSKVVPTSGPELVALGKRLSEDDEIDLSPAPVAKKVEPASLAERIKQDDIDHAAIPVGQLGGGIYKNEAIAERRKAARRVVAALKKGDVLIDSNGNKRVLNSDPTGESAVLDGDDFPTNLAYHFQHNTTRDSKNRTVPITPWKISPAKEASPATPAATSNRVVKEGASEVADMAALPKGTVVRSDNYKSEGNITIDGPLRPRPIDGVMSYPASVNGRGFNLLPAEVSSVITPVTPTPVSSQSFSPATQAEETKKPTPPTDENQSETDAKRKADADVEAKRKRLLTEGAAGDSSPAASDLKLATAAGRLETVSKALSSLTGKLVEMMDKRPDSATFEVNKGKYQGDENVWSYDGKVFMSQGFLKSLEGMDKGKALQMLQDKAKALSSVKETTLNATAASKTTDTSKSDLLSNTLTNSDPLAPVMSVGENVLSGEAKPSYLKGTFTKDGDTYLYTPDKGTTLPLGMGSLVAVKGTDSVLSLVGVVNGDFVFRRIDFNRVVDMGGKGKRPINNVNSLSRNWNTTRIAAIAPKFLKLLPKISSGKLSESDARSLLNDVIKIIAPNRSIESIQEAELPGDQFFQAFSTPVEVKGKDAKGIIAAADGKFYKAVVGVRVDYKKLAAQLATLSQGHKSGNEDMDMLVAMDAARQMVSWMGEENIHTLTLDETHFPKPVMEKFFTDILSDKAHPFHDLLRITAKEQFPDIELSEADDTESFAYTVASEMLRKLQQIRQTGSTSEINAAYARRLIEVINDKSVTGKVKAAVELVKRFFERMRRILYLRQAMNQITPEQAGLLARLNSAYINAGFNEDVDDIKSKQTQEQALIAHTYFESTRLEIDKVAAKNSTPLMRLREVARDVFTNLGINVIHVDPDTGDMALDPAAAEYLQENHPLFDTKEINKALEELNDTESFRKSLTQSYFLSEVVKSRLEELSFDPTDLYNWIGGRGEMNPSGVMSHILAGAAQEQRYYELASFVKESIEAMSKDRSFALNVMISKARKMIAGLDMNKSSDVRRALTVAVKLGIESTDGTRDPNSLEIGSQQWHELLMMQTSLLTPGDVLARKLDGDGFKAIEKATESINHAKARLEALLQLQEEQDQGGSPIKASQAKLLSVKDKIIRLQNRASTLDDAGRTKEAAVERLKAQFLKSSLGVDESLANEKYAQFSRYMKALKDYNESVDGVLYRAIGRNNPDKREFGLDFRDTSFNINTIEDEKKGSPGNGSKAQPFGMQMPNPPAVTKPSDFAGYNINTPFNEKGTNLPGYGNPRMSKPTDTPEHRELWDNHYRQVFGNAKYRGRHAINWFLLQDALGNLPMDLGSRDDFMRTAGFNLAAEINDKLGIRFFENHNQAFPGLNLYDRLFTLLDTMKEENRVNASMDFKQVIDIFSQTKAWANKIRSKVEGENFIGEINGVPTLAGEAKVLLDRRLKEFDDQMKGFEDAMYATLEMYFRTKLTSTGVQYLENEKGLMKKDGVNEQEIYQRFRQQLSSNNKVGPQALMVQAMSSLNTSVKIVRKSLESFQDKDWQRNQEEEMDRTLNDYAYTPDHAEMLALRDQKLDPSVVRQLSWTMRFHEKSAGYSVGSLHAYELLGERLKGEWNNDGRLLVTKLTRDREVGSLDQEGLGVSSVGDIENSGHMPLAFATGEQGNTRDSALNEKVGATQSTAAERNTRELMTPYQIQRHWLTRSLMFLGYGKGINGEGSANAAKDFAYDVIQQSEGTTRNGLHELMLRGLSGAFSMVYRNTPAFENLVEMFVEANPEWHYAFGEDSSVVFDESDRTIRFDPETFASDILMFKAKFETDALEKVRISEKASVTEVMEALLSHATIDPTNDNLNLDNPNFNQSQEGRPSLNLPSEINERNATLVRAFKSDMGRDIKMGLYDARILESRKDLGDLVSPLEDTFVSGGLFVDNPALGVLLQNLTGGKVFVYVPSADAMKREGINHGVVTISHGDITLIVTPPGIASSQEEVKTAMRHALLHHATSSKESTSAINEMGARVREMFDPVFRTQQLLTGMQAQRDAIIDNATNHPAYKGSKKQLDRLNDEVKAMVAKRIAEHLQKTARLFESNGLFMGRSNTWATSTSPLLSVPVDSKGRKSKKAIQAATRSAGGLVDTVVESNSTRSDKFTNLNENLQAQLEDNVDLITDILVDPKFKEMFDAAFLGTDEIDSNNLSDVHNLQLFGAIHGIRNTLESNEGFPDEKFPDESHAQAWNDDQQEEDERSAEEIENERIDRELSEDEAMRHIVASIADNLGGVMRTDGTLVLTEDSSVLPDAADLNQALKNLGALISSDSKRETKLFKLKGSEHVINPGDAALLNMLARVVASAKDKTSDIDLDSVLVEGESPKRILNGLPSGEFGGAIIRPINRPSRGANNNSTPMGSWVNITRGAAHGRTAQTIAFAFMRQEKMRAALIAQLSSVQKSLDDLAKKRIAKDLMDQPDIKEHGNVFVDVAVDSAFIAEMDEATGGLVSKHIEETEAMVADLRQAQSDQIAALEEIKRDIEQRLLPYESSENAVDAYIDSDLFEVEAAQELFDNLGNSIIESMNEGLYEGGELRAGRVISALVSKRLSPTGNLLLKAHREKAQRLLKEIQGKLELRRSGFTTGDKKNFKDKHIESLVKDFNETIDTLMKGVNTVVREGFGQVDMASTKVDLPRPRLVWNDGLADNAISDAIRAMGRIASPQAVADVVKDMMLSRTTQAAAEKFGRGKGSREFTEQIAAIVKAYDTDGVVGMKKMFTEAMDSLANKDFDISGGPGKASGMRALLKGLILNNDEVVNMLKDGVKLPSDVAEIEAMKQLQRKIESSLKETSESLKKISETKDSYQMGRYHHDIKAGLEKSDWDPKSTKKRFEIAPTDRQVPVTMNLVPDNYNPIHQTGDSLQQERLRFLQEEDDRFDFYAKREGVMRALSEFTDGRLEEAYKRVRGSAENFSTFNPFAMIKQALKLANIEKMIMDEREAGAKTLAERVAYRGMTVEAIAAITGGDFYTVSEDKPLTDEQNRRAYFESPGQPTNRQKRVAFYKSPQGFGERMKLAGHLFDDGKPILLMAQDARTQLMEQFPDVTKHNVDSVLKEQVLNALTVKRAVAKKRITDSYMLEFDKGYIKGDFDPTGYRILAGQTKVSRQDAAKVFVSNFVEKIQAFVEDRGKNPLAGLKDANGLHVLSDTEKLSMDHDNVKKVIALYSNMIEKIVYAQGHKLLDDDASRKVRNFLLSISESEYKDMNDPDNVLGGFANNDNSMQQFDLMGTFATVFSAIEGDVILRRLAVGLSSPTITGKLGLGNLRLLHGQDSRIRSRFIKDAAAHDTAIHLQAFLEQGFDGQTGREGAEAQSQWINRKIADSLKTIGNDSLDHAIAKDIATLEGIKHNRGMGVKAALEKFHHDYTKGFKNLIQYDLAQRDAYRRIGSKFFNSKHIQLTDDIPMAKEKDKLLSRGLNEVMVNMMSSGNTSEENDQQAIDLIDSMIADLLKGRKNADKIKAHAELVEKEMRSISDAMAISRAVLSHGAELAGAGEMTNEWKHDPVTAFEQSYTSVPLSFSYAAAPGVETSMTKGQYISDPALLTSLSNGAIYGGPGKFAGMMNQGRIIYRPLQVNGITSINSLVEDSVYRMNVAPSYEVLRRLVGRTESPRGIPTATDSKMLNDAQMRGKVSHTTLQSFNNSLAAVATELESNLQNDSQSGVDSTRFARVMELETARFIWKALGSPWQLVNQSLGPSLAVIIKKLVTLQGREAYDFVTVLTKIIVSGSVSLIPDMVLSDQRAFKNFNSRIRNFNHDVSIYTNKQGMDGIDNTKNVTRNQLSHGSNPLMKYGGFALNKFQSYTEGYLDNTIGAAERTVGRAVFAMEMMSELRKAKARGEFAGDVPKNVDELIKLRKQDIPTLAKARARIKVSDMLGQGDNAKKAEMFQNHTTSPTVTALVKSLSRFSSQTASTAGNMQVFAHGLFSPGTDFQTRLDAFENIVGTLTQNLLFNTLKVKTAVPLFAFLFNTLIGGDDEERAAKKAQKLANEWLVPSKEGLDGDFSDIFKTVVFGPKSEFFRMSKESGNKTADAAIGSAFAGLLSKSLVDGLTMTPLVGAGMGYSSVSDLAQRFVTNNAAEHVLASRWFMDMKVAKNYWDTNKIGIPEYDKGFMQTIADLTSPSADVYNTGKDVIQLYEGFNTRRVTPWELAMKTLSIAVPVTPEFNKQVSKELKEKIRDATPKKDRP